MTSLIFQLKYLGRYTKGQKLETILKTKGEKRQFAKSKDSSTVLTLGVG